MGLISKIFGKNKSYLPQNSLENLLATAAKDPGARPEFYKQLFHFDLLVLGSLEEDGEKRSVIFHLLTGPDDGDAIRAFTSKEALEYILTTTKSPPQSFVIMRAFDLFKMIQGRHGILLNYGLPYGKYFTIPEVASMLMANPASVQEVKLSSGMEMQIGQPSEVPNSFLSALKTYLKNTPALEDLYFGLQCVEKKEFTYLLIFQFKTNSVDPSPFMNDVGLICKELTVDRPVDMCLVNSHFLELFKAGALISVKTIISEFKYD